MVLSSGVHFCRGKSKKYPISAKVIYACVNICEQFQQVILS